MRSLCRSAVYIRLQMNAVECDDVLSTACKAVADCEEQTAIERHLDQREHLLALRSVRKITDSRRAHIRDARARMLKLKTFACVKKTSN